MPDATCTELRWLLTSPMIFAALPGIALMPAQARQRIAWALEDGAGAGRHGAIPQVGSTATVGHRAEALLASALARCPGIDLVASRLPLRTGATTLGDLDLLYDDHQRACRVHTELAVRILLQREPAAGTAAWCGSDPRQTLETKLAHLRGHQLPLGRHPLVPRHAAWPTVSEALILGWLLQPAGARWPLPPGVAGHHLRGWWLRHGEGEPPRASRAARFHLIPQDGWMRWIDLPDAAPVLAPGELSRHLRQHFARHAHAVLLAEVVRDRAGGWREQARGMVVHGRWPEPPGPTGGVRGPPTR